MTIFIGGLGFQVRGNDLREMFSHFGEIVFARVNLDRETHKSKGFGFVEFANPIDAERAINEIDTLGHNLYDVFSWSEVTYGRVNLDREALMSSILFGFEHIIVAYAWSSVIRQIASGRIDIHKITPRQFEELIAELLKNLGYKCELTSLIKDGGKDIIAIQTDGVLSNNIYVECKHYRSDNPVGINAIKKLHSTIIDDRVTKGIMVTTSRFTKGAQEFIKKNRWILEGKDCDDIFNWIKQYTITKFNYNEDEANKLTVFGSIEDETLKVKDENAF